MKKKHHDHEEDHPVHHDESNWLVSYADMMTLLFGFFVLMYSMSRVDTEQFTVVGKDVAKFFGGKVKEDKGLVVAVKDVKELMQTFMKDMEGKGAVSKDEGQSLAGNPPTADGTEEETDVTPDKTVEVEQKVNTLTLKFRGSILFGSGSAELKPDFAKVLADLGEKLKATGRVQEIRVEGHTDDNPIRSSVFPTNWELSASRASRIVRQFETTGLDSKALIAEGLGSSRPEAPNRDEAGKALKDNQARNRRVVVVVKFNPMTKENQDALESDFEKKKRENAMNKAGVQGSSNMASNGDQPAEAAPATPAEVEAKIKETQERLAEAKAQLKAKEEEAKKQRKLTDLQEKLNELNRKAQEVEAQLKGSGQAPAAQDPVAPTADKAPASVK
jgi:chemotaxis protein MotB